MVRKRSRFGPFWACTRYPACKGTRKIGGGASPNTPTGVRCPECGGPGKMRFGRLTSPWRWRGRLGRRRLENGESRPPAYAGASFSRAAFVLGKYGGLVAVLAERPRDLRLARRGEPGRRRRAARAVHPHVERAVLLEREAALGAVDLHRGDAEVGQDARDAADAAGSTASRARRSSKNPTVSSACTIRVV